MQLDDTTPCWGRSYAPICDACTRRQAPEDYAGSFPVMDLLLPAAYPVRQVDGRLEWFCAERRSAGMHRPAAVCARGCRSVGADAYCVHTRTLGGAADKGKPLELVIGG